MKDKIEILKTYESVVEAAVDKDVLTKNEILSYLDDELTNPILPTFTVMNGGGYNLFVFERDLDNALKIIEEFHAKVD
jgi:hypothetical protein